MRKAMLKLFVPYNFIGPGQKPKQWDKPAQQEQKLLSRNFVLLFLMAMCSNSFIAVYYCFEQWLKGIGIPPDWRGLLLSSMFAMLLVFRPLTSIIMLKHGKLWPMTLSLIVCTLVMPVYPFITQSYAIPAIMAIRLVQGVALAVYSACTVSVLVQCIPPGQSAKGFAIFSLTMLLPYSIIPGISEILIPIVGGEAKLFAWVSILSLPSFFMLALLSKKLREPEISPDETAKSAQKNLFQSLTHSGLFYVFSACFFFSITTILAIFFMKGLCTLNSGKPAYFFTTYTITIMLVRIFGSRLMDTLPRHRVTVICSAALSIVMASFALCSKSWLIPLSASYGLAIGLLYPLLAAAIYDRSTKETRSVNSNIMMAMFDAAGMTGPILGGMVIDWNFGYKGTFFTAAISAMLCGVFMTMDFISLHKKKQPNNKPV